MVEQFAAPPINPIVSITPLSTTAPNRDSSGIPAALANLPPGTTIEGFVVNRDATNNPILRTPIGDLQMQSDVFVKTGSTMVIRVDATSETRARIITIDGLVPQDYAAQNSRGITQDTIMPSQLLQRPTGTAPGALPVEGKPIPLQAMLLASPAQAGTPNPLFMQMPGATSPVPAGLMKLQAGAALKVMVLQMELPSQIQTAHQQPQNPNPVQAQAQRPGAPIPPNMHIQPPMQGAVQQISMASPEAAKIAQQPNPLMAETQAPRAPMITPGPPPAANLPAASAHQQLHTTSVPPATPAGIPALVIGHEADGGNIVQTNFGMLKIYTPAPLPVHTKLTVEVKPDIAAPPQQSLAPVTVAGGEGDSLNTLSRGWPHLSDALSWMATQDPAGGRDTMQMLPQIGPKLTSGLIFFLAAVKGGDIRQWMGGRKFDQLELKMPELAAKLKGDMVQLQQLFLHSPLDQWSGVMLPMLHGNQLDYARLYLRNESDDKGGQQQGKGKEQRFIVEIELSHLGEMQFDGFVRQTSPKKQFDLMIRTAKPLDNAMANEIRAMFETSIGATGYNGYLGFQQGAQHFVRPLAGKGGIGDRPLDSHTILA